MIILQGCDNLEKLFKEVSIKLANLIEHTDENDENDVKRTTNYLGAIIRHIVLINQERGFKISDKQKEYLRRGSVVWVDFGFNIGHEFGGHHPAIILREFKGTDMYTVIPIDSDPDTEEALQKRKNDDCWVEIPYINNMKKGNRWVNVYRVLNVSAIRINLNSLSNAYINKYILYEIDKKIALYQYKPYLIPPKSKKAIDKIKEK